MNQSSLLFGPLEELQELAFIERPIRRSLKTAEEIDQLTVDEDLNDIERAVYLLSVGQEVQRASVISNLPSLVRQNPAETFRRVVPKVRRCCSACLTVVSNAWLETLLLAINALPKETIKQEVLNPLLYQSQLSHSLQARLASCRILGKVACKFDSHMMDDTRTELLPELVELAEDEESSVRLAAFDTIINLMEMMDSDDRLHVVVPLVMSVCEVSSQVDEAVMASLSFQFGKLCNGLTGSLSEEQKARLLQRFKVLCVAGLQNEGNSTDGNNESTLIRCNCCYNLPAMVVFSDPSHFLSELYPSFYSLCCDPEVSVRRSAAASFHQVVKLLGSNVQLVHKELLALLQDDALEFPELLSVLLLAEQKVGCSLRWRLHEKLLQRYSCLARLLPENCCTRISPLASSSSSPPMSGKYTQHQISHQVDQVSTHIISPLVVVESVAGSKGGGSDVLHIPALQRKQEQRQEMMERLIQDLAQGRSYWNRLRFLDVCEMATEIFSRKYFNKHFLIPALELVHDPVANVRYKLCQLLPRLRSSLRLPADKQLLQQLDFCVQKLLCREKDKDVVATIRKTVLELDKLDLTEPFHKRQERDLLDQKKEKEETLLLEMEQLERQQTDGKLNSEKHTERKRRDCKTSLSATKSMSVSSSGAALSSSGKEMRKAKLSRSRSLSSQPTTSKSANSDRPLKVKELNSPSGPKKSSVLLSKDDSLRTAHFTMASQSSSSMPVLIRSNTTSLLDRASTLDHRSGSMDHRTSTLEQRDHRTITLEQRTSSMDHRTSTLDHRTTTIDQRDHRTSTLDHRTTTIDQRDHRTSTLDHRTTTIDQRDHRTSTLDHRTTTIDQRDHRTSTLDHRMTTIDQRDHRNNTIDQRDHRTSTMDHRSKTMDRGCGVKDSQSRKLSM
ncbi:Serine/threonine-protein phosphatase 4 regulatory subunit 4 [Collichthys lucidus]|uniref:Serine/threonine-protein phosphatase 4 regulatory subunit 4 n=1 Tax=Collichthys lucidus TaxID=240159 RepID=A0A4V6XYC3_COLLU|nr:Serine/threonine-protein phosphatase 4 regulatory subunit 4 [Collichthys lucidus]